MERIHFLDTESEQIVEAYRITSVNPQIFGESHVIEIDFVENIPNDIVTNGFELINEFNEESMTGDYYFGYTTIYRKIDDKSIMLSNDGSIYVEPEPETPSEEPEEDAEQTEGSEYGAASIETDTKVDDTDTAVEETTVENDEKNDKENAKTDPEENTQEK